MSKYSVIVTPTRCGKHGRGGIAIQLPTDLKHDMGLSVGDHLTISSMNDVITITKDFKCRICQKYTNQLFSKVMLAVDGNKYHSLYHCGACRDVPDYSKKVD